MIVRKHMQQILTVRVLAKFFAKRLQLPRIDKTHPKGDLFGTGDHHALPLLNRLNELLQEPETL